MLEKIKKSHCYIIFNKKIEDYGFVICYYIAGIQIKTEEFIAKIKQR